MTISCAHAAGFSETFAATQRRDACASAKHHIRYAYICMCLQTVHTEIARSRGVLRTAVSSSIASSLCVWFDHSGEAREYCAGCTSEILIRPVRPRGYHQHSTSIHTHTLTCSNINSYHAGRGKSISLCIISRLTINVRASVCTMSF